MYSLPMLHPDGTTNLNLKHGICVPEKL